MKILILNDEDVWMARKRDIRSWTFRGLWFANAGDIVVAMDDLPVDFVRHVAETKGFNPKSLSLVVAPPGEYGRGEFDGRILSDATVMAKIKANPSFHEIDCIEALWPTPSVAHLAMDLKIPNLLPGCAFISSCGYEPANSKAFFRAIASAAGVSIPEGYVARSEREALDHSLRLFSLGDAIIVKRDHGGAGGGNHLVKSPTWGGDASIAGAARVTELEKISSRTLGEFWGNHWEWMSNSGSAPVVLETHVSGWDTFYAEFRIGDDCISGPHLGQLTFSDGGLTLEVLPSRPEGDGMHKLCENALILAEKYQAIGYRGYLSADAIVSPQGSVLFTEVNSRYTGSTHLYSVMKSLPVAIENESPRIVMQAQLPQTSLSETLSNWRQRGIAYSSKYGVGAVALTPELGGIDGPIAFNAIGRSLDEAQRIFEAVLEGGDGL